MEEWLSEAPTSRPAVERFRTHVREQLAPLTWFKSQPDLKLVGQGGSLRNSGRLIQKLKRYPIDELHGYSFRRDELNRIVQRLEPLSLEGRRGILGMKPDRADIALGAAIVIEECMRFAQFDSLTVCSQGLREGLFYERFLANPTTPTDSQLYFPDVRRASVLNVAHMYRFQQDHANHVANLALSLSDQIAALMPYAALPPEDRELLWAAAILHDIGMNIDYNDHHRHSYYLILNSGLPGYSHREQAMIALAALYHRKGSVSVGDLGSLLNVGDATHLVRMTAMLRLAEQLDRSRDGAVRQVTLSEVGRAVRLAVHSEADVSVSIWSAQNRADIFELAYGKPLEIVAAGGQ
jgi:exopolyphosphatase / guanosine-5'-triphosphate,3'-diphosphate pyrophosphatase